MLIPLMKMLTNCHLDIGSLEFEQGLSEDDYDDCGEDDSHKDDSDEDEEFSKKGKTPKGAAANAPFGK